MIPPPFSQTNRNHIRSTLSAVHSSVFQRPVNAWSGSDSFSSIAQPVVAITYHAKASNADTGAVIACGSSVPKGTKIKFEFVPHEYTDIYWFTSGFAFDSPYGDWIAGAARPYADMCNSKADKDYIGTYTWSLGTVTQYTALAVDPPPKTFSASPLLDCTGSSSDMSRTCTAARGGTASNSFNFATTIGRFYGRIYWDRPGAFGGGRSRFKEPSGGGGEALGSGCYTSNNPMYLNRNAPYTMNVAAQTISCNITITGDTTSGPTPPAIIPGSCAVGSPTTIFFTSTDSEGRQLKYGIDWDADGSVDQWVPPSGYVNSGVQQSASRTYSTSGQKTVSVIAQNDQGAISSWSTSHFICRGLSCPAGYVQQGDQCVFDQCPAGYTQQGTQCVLACTALCQGADIVNSCTHEVLQHCDWGCANGRCNPTPAPTGDIRATPSLVPSGNATSVSWTSQNATGCTVTSTNGSSWTGLYSAGQTSLPILAQTIFSLHCTGYPGADPSYFDKSVTVKLIPAFEEK